MKYFWKKNFLGVLLALICLCVPFVIRWSETSVYQTSSSTANISKHESVIDVGEDGSIYFHETITLNTTWKAVYKDIYYGQDPRNTYVQSINPEFDVDSVSVSVVVGNGTVLFDDQSASLNTNSKILGFQWKNDRDELGQRITCPNNASDCQSIFIYNADGFGQNTKITYNYRIKYAAVRYNDITELNWNFATTNGMLSKNMEVTINLPKPVGVNITTDDVYIYGHEASYGKIETSEADPYKIVLKAAKLLPNERIEARILYPNTLSRSATARNTIAAPHLQRALDLEKSNQGTNKIYYIVDLVGIGFIVLGVIGLIFVLIRTYRKYDKEYKSDFYLDIYRELPAEYGPAVMGYLYRFKEITKNDVSATLMDLVRRGFIKIDAEGQSLTDKNANYTLIYDNSKDQSELKEHEKYLLTWFFDVVAGGTTLTLNQLQDFTKKESNAIKYMNCDMRWCIMLRNVAEKEHFFETKKESKGRYNSVLLSVLLLVISLLCLSMPVVSYMYGAGIFAGFLFFSAFYTSNIIKRSVKGNEDYVRWKAFRKFLCEFSNIKDYPMPGIIVWEHYMVYATAFGVADLVDKQLKFKFKELHMEDQLRNSTFFHYPIFYMYWSTNVTRSFTTAKQTINVARAQRVKASASRGGRGGFGGGSSFGGGGSGMRGR